jgi:hypothetical protein
MVLVEVILVKSKKCTTAHLSDKCENVKYNNSDIITFDVLIETTTTSEYDLESKIKICETQKCWDKLQQIEAEKIYLEEIRDLTNEVNKLDTEIIKLQNEINKTNFNK